MLRLLWYLCAGALTLPWSSLSQAPITPPPRYLTQQWTADDGLPVNHINDLIRTTDGFLWLATGDGLIRFDGTHFRTYTTGTTPELPSSRITLLETDLRGNLWIFTEQRNVVRYRDGRFQAYPDFPALVTGPHLPLSWPIYAAPDSSFWIGTETGALVYRDGQMQPFRPEELGKEVYGFAGDPQGDFYIATDDGLYHTQPSTPLRSYPTADGVSDLQCRSVSVDQQQRVWVSTTTGVYRLEGDRLRLISTNFEALGTSYIYQDPSGTVYFDTAVGGTFRFDEEAALIVPHAFLGEQSPDKAFAAPLRGVFDWRYDLTPRRDRTMIFYGDERILTLPPGVILNAFALGPTGQAWLGTSNGLYRLRPSAVTVWTRPPDGWEGSGTNVYPITQTQDGAIWIGTLSSYVLRISGQVVQSFNNLGLPVGHPWALLEDRNGQLWVGGYSLCGLEPRAPCSTVEPPQGIGELRALYEDSQNRFWMGGEAGFVHRDGDQWHLPDSAVGSVWARAFLETQDGAIWIATNGQGAIRYKEGRYEQLDRANGGCSNLVRDLYQDVNGHLWLATEDRGLCRIRNPEAALEALDVATIGQTQGLYQNAVHSILEDDAGRLWMNSNQGIFWVPRADLNAAADDRLTQVTSTWYDERDGLLNREGNGGVQSAAFKDAQGRLWFATQEGAVMIEPEHAVTNAPFGAIVIDAVESGNEAVALEDVHLTAGQRDVSIRYVKPDLISTKPVQYQYRLVGQDDRWYDAGLAREARFTNLTGSAYTFEVRTTDLRGQQPGAITALSVTRTPYVHETGWFILVLLVGSLGLVYGGVQLRLRRIRARNRQLQSRVVERTAELETALATVAEQADELRSLDAAKSRFFANVSHELRTPLTLIIGPLRSLLDGDHGYVPDATSHQHRLMLRNSRRLLRLINQILDLAQVESGALPLYAYEQDLVAFVAHNVDAFKPLAHRHNLDLRLHAHDTACLVYFDPQQLEIVVVNLLSNALKFTPAGGRVDVTVERTGAAAVVRVQDTGQGIAQENLERVFDRFFQQEGSQGTGIGLALVRELVHLHHGQITVASEEGQGATFTVYLPLGAGHLTPDQRVAPRDVPSSELHTDTLEPESSTFTPVLQTHSADTPLVLLVDDNPDIRAYLTTLLHSRYRLAEASNGHEAIEQVHRQLPDLIVSDVMMPQQDGFALSRALKADPMTAHIPLILLTAKASSTSTLEGLSSGADDYLTKPFDPDELRARIHNQLVARQRLRARYSTPSPSPPPPDEDALSDQARAVVLSHLADPSFTVQQLAEALHLTYATFNRRLRKDANITPNAFIRHVRLDEAARLLQNGAGSVSEVAYAVGFNSLSYFTKSFSERFDCLPSTYIASGSVPSYV